MATNINNGETGVSVRTKINNAFSELNAIIAAAVTLTGTQVLTNKTLTLPQINDTSSDHQYIFAVNELVADRTVTLPLLGANDTFVFEAHAQTLTNKTLTSPAITTPTGIVKGDVGLGNVDNTSDVNKPLSTATTNALILKQDANAVTTLKEEVIPSPTGVTVSDLTYNHKFYYFTNTGAINLNLNGGGNTFPIGGIVSFYNSTGSTNDVTIVGTAGATAVSSTGSLVAIPGRAACCMRVDVNLWVRLY
jgi:hypothetical protein